MSSFRRATLLMSFVLAVSAVGMPGSPALAAVGPEDPWAPGTSWVSLRAGSARSGEANAPESGYGAGFGYSKMLGGWLKKFSLGAYIHFENLGSLGDATEYSIPVTLEMARHMRLTREIQPYLGFGGGAYYRKLYRTGDDTGTFEPGFYILLGANTPIYKAGVLGFDLRLNWVDVSSDDPNPVFAPKESTTTQMGLKINYSIVY
jgi:hypothetical protein